MEKLLAAGGVLGAFAVSTCCVLPLALAAIGVGGAWIGSLAMLAAYQPYLLAGAALCVGLGFWRAHRQVQPVCDGPDCSPLTSQRFTKAALWFALVLLLVAGSAEWWGRHLA